MAYDRPMPVPLTLAEDAPDGPVASVPGAGQARTVRVRARHNLRLRAGDLLLAPGARFEWAEVAAGVDLAPGRPAAVALAPGGDGGGWSLGRPAGTPLDLVRPGRLVRYAVVALGPEDTPRPDGVPCLVRFETACPRDGREPCWTAALERPARARGIRREVLARGVRRFRAAFHPATGGKGGPGGFRVDLAVAGAVPGGCAAGTLRLALRNGGG